MASGSLSKYFQNHDHTGGRMGTVIDTATLGSITIGAGEVGVDYSITFDGETNDGVVTWMEDEDYFLFNDTIFMFDAKPIYFRSTQSYIYSENAGIITLFGATNIDLVSNAIVIGKNTDEDISFTFNAATNDGIVTWMEDEDYFKFSDDVMIGTGENIYLVDTNTYLRHDGTNVILADDTKINLFSNAITFGTSVDSDITLTFQANSNTGVFVWMEDEDYFKFSDCVRTEGGRKINVTVVITTYAALVTDELIVCNSTSAFTVTLPVASGSGQKFYIKNINTGIITVDGNGADTIDGSASVNLLQWEAVQVVDYAANKWVII
jgi:hypothetical protein